LIGAGASKLPLDDKGLPTIQLMKQVNQDKKELMTMQWGERN